MTKPITLLNPGSGMGVIKGRLNKISTRKSPRRSVRSMSKFKVSPRGACSSCRIAARLTDKEDEA